MNIIIVNKFLINQKLKKMLNKVKYRKAVKSKNYQNQKAIIFIMCFLSAVVFTNAQAKKYSRPVVTKHRELYKPSKAIEITQPQGTTATTIKNLAVNGMAYKLYEPATATYSTPKGIVVIGSGNSESAPTVGLVDGTKENALCKLAADNGYVTAIVAYTQGTGVSDWNGSALKMGNDFDVCITDISTKYNISKSKSVIAGISYTSFMLYSNISMDNKLSYCKGLIAACGSTGTWNAENFKIPIYALNCGDNYEQNLNGKALYDAIPASNPNKALSDGYTDMSCVGHCEGNWIQLMFDRVKFWLP
jgi:hypothetical protein